MRDGGERTIDERLEALASELAAASDITKILAMRDEIIDIMGRLKVTNLRAQRAMRARARAVRRARALRWQAEVIAGEILIAMKAGGLLRTSVGGDQKTRRAAPVRA
jgi:hypothetical protein